MKARRVRVDIEQLAYSITASYGKRFITTSELARLLGTSTYTAGRILAEMAREGLALRWSRRTYKLVHPGKPRVRE